MPVHVINEAKRCLNCKNPLCRTGCPINTPIPQMIEMLLGGDINKAGAMVFANNPLSIVCSLVCDHEKQCEGHCILGRKGVPVQIGPIENYISDHYFPQIPPVMGAKGHCKAAIIGSGPAGITISILLAQRGYDVTIFEAREGIGGVLRYGIPAFRLPKSILDDYRDKLLSMGIHIRPNTSIGAVLGVDDLLRDGYKAIFIGTGVWKPNTLGIPGESLGNVHYALDYLSNPDAYRLGEKVAVIGAGNSAMDAARTALRKGAREVTVYLRSQKVAASALEVEYAKIDGVRFETGKSPVAITDDGPIFQAMEFPLDEAGNPTGRGAPIPGSDALSPADATIISIGQGPRNQIVSTTYGIEINERGLIRTDEEGRTTRPGIFASGDVVKGAKTVVEAVAFSKKVADAMDMYMKEVCESGEEQ